MLILIKLIGTWMIVIGIIIFFMTKAFSTVLNFFMQGKRVYIAGILRILIGIIFLMAAQQCRLKLVVFILGVLTLIGGILVFALKREKINAMISWFSKCSPAIIRIWGIVAAAIGVLIIYSA